MKKVTYLCIRDCRKLAAIQLLAAIRPTQRRITTLNKIWTQENEQLTTFLTETEF